MVKSKIKNRSLILGQFFFTARLYSLFPAVSVSNLTTKPTLTLKKSNNHGLRILQLNFTSFTKMYLLIYSYLRNIGSLSSRIMSYNLHVILQFLLLPVTGNKVKLKLNIIVIQEAFRSTKFTSVFKLSFVNCLIVKISNFRPTRSSSAL